MNDGNHRYALRAGEQLPAQPYQIIRPLGVGEGTMTEVYLAQPLPTASSQPASTSALPQPVVLKIANRPSRRGDLGTQALAKESRLLQALHHPHIVRPLPIAPIREPLTFIQQVELQGAPSFMVLEYLPHGSLAQWLVTQRHPLPLRLVLAIGYCLAAALDYLHRCGIVHLDLKPRNLALRHPIARLEPQVEVTPRGPVLIDFGSAQPIGTAITLDEVTFQPSAYLPPECIQALPSGAVIATEAFDRYALGVILYQLRCGRLPFMAQEPAALEQAIINQAVQLATTAGAVHRGEERAQQRLDAVILHALAKQARNRPSAGQMASSLWEASCWLPQKDIASGSGGRWQRCFPWRRR